MSAVPDDRVDARLAALAWAAVERVILPKMLEIHEAALREALAGLQGRAIYIPKGCDGKRQRRNEAMRGDYLRGMSVDQVADEHHVSPATAARILKGGV